MADYIYSIILLIVALGAIELRKSYYSIPKSELRLMARNGDVLAQKLYRAVAYEESLDTLLWLVIILCIAGSLIFFNKVAPFWLDFIAIVFFIWLAFAWLPRVAASGLSEKLAAFVTPGIVFVLNYLHPIFERIHGLVSHKKPYTHTGLYDKKDLIKLIDNQTKQPDNRINVSDLELIKNVLKLSDKAVGDYAENWSKIHHAIASDTVGPVLLDELHKSGQSFIPVVETSKSKEIVGMIDLNRLNISNSGQIKDFMNQNVYYLNEDDTLLDALSAMTDTGQQVYVVVDKKRRVFGMITLKDIVNKLVTLSPKTKEHDLVEPENKPTSETETA